MFLLRMVLFVSGGLIVATIVRSATRSFVMPRAAPDRLGSIVFLTMRALFDLRMIRSREYEDRDRIMALYAPLTLLALPVVWLSLVLVGYACMFWAVGIQPVSAALRLSGSSLLTLGFSAADDVVATLLAFSEAMIGLLLVALLIAYLPTMYAAFARREAAVSMLETRAGSPPTPVEMFRRFHRLERMALLKDLWVQWEVWFVDLEESHTSLAALSFFRSPQPDHSWVTAAGAVLDSAALAASTLDIPRDPQAELCIRAGYLALRRIADFFGIHHNPNPGYVDPISVTREEWEAVYDQLRIEGVPLKADRDQCWRDFKGWRVNYDTVLIGLADLTMSPPAPWSSDRKPGWKRKAASEPVGSVGTV